MSRIRTSTGRTRVRTALLTLPVVTGVLGAVAAAPAGATPHYGPHPAPHPASTSLTCRGEGVDPGAIIRYRAETVVHAPLSTIWKLQTDVKRWPSWQGAVETAKRLDHGPLRKGSAFVWTAPVPATPTTPATT